MRMVGALAEQPQPAWFAAASRLLRRQRTEWNVDQCVEVWGCGGRRMRGRGRARDTVAPTATSSITYLFELFLATTNEFEIEGS